MFQEPPSVLPDTFSIEVPDKRILSLDVFRGATIVGMILVNNPGTWAAIYPPLRHAEWHGWTPTDLIFPFFLFIVGVAIVFAYTRRMVQGVPRGRLLKKALRRSIILFGLGLLLHAFPYVTFEPSFAIHPRIAHLRIMGVLQRIALCYLVASLLFLYVRPRLWQGLLVLLLLGYWALMSWIPVPGYGAGVWDSPDSSLAAYLDRLILGSHTWGQRPYDPEGLLSTLPAIGTTLLGVWAGIRLIQSREGAWKVAEIMVLGFGLIIIGYIWDWFFPINKSLWTSSYAVFTGGIAMCMLGMLYWFIDVHGHTRWTRPFVIYGINAITVFFLSGILGRLLIMIKVSDGEKTVALQRYIFTHVFSGVGSPEFASLLYAMVWVIGWYAILYLMYKKNIVIKV